MATRAWLATADAPLDPAAAGAASSREHLLPEGAPGIINSHGDRFSARRRRGINERACKHRIVARRHQSLAYCRRRLAR